MQYVNKKALIFKNKLSSFWRADCNVNYGEVLEKVAFSKKTYCTKEVLKMVHERYSG